MGTPVVFQSSGLNALPFLRWAASPSSETVQSFGIVAVRSSWYCSHLRVQVWSKQIEEQRSSSVSSASSESNSSTISAMRPVFLARAGVDVAAGGDVEVVFRNLLMGDDAAVFLHFPPRLEGVGDAGDGILRDVVLRVALGELVAALSRKSFPLRSFGLALFRKRMMPGAVVL